MPLPEGQRASRCPHVTRLEKAKGLCSPCYRAQQKAERIAKNRIKVDDETGLEVKTGKDILATSEVDEAKELERILWSWIKDHEKVANAEYFDEAGNRDYRTEVRMQDLKAQLAMKGATILSRKLIAEKKDETKPEDLPGQATLNGFMSGWMKAAQVTPSPRQRATGEKGDLSDLDADDAFDA
jgi:hypothetical protein